MSISHLPLNIGLILSLWLACTASLPCLAKTGLLLPADCSVACQKQHWKQHKKECSQFRQWRLASKLPKERAEGAMPLREGEAEAAQQSSAQAKQPGNTGSEASSPAAAASAMPEQQQEEQQQLGSVPGNPAPSCCPLGQVKTELATGGLFCAHPACANFEGSSEAALPLQRCAGCRVATYCR